MLKFRVVLILSFLLRQNHKIIIDEGLEMPKCPKCGEEISELFYKVIDNGRVWLNDKGEIEYELASDIYGDEQKSVGEFRCPECGEVLFASEHEAIEFLKPKTKQTTLT